MISGSRSAAVVVGLALALAVTPAFARHHKPVRLKRVALTEAAQADEAPRPLAPKAWLHKHLPENATFSAGVVTHKARAGETFQSIAEQYLDLSSVYDAGDFAKDIAKANPDAKHGALSGTTITIPKLLDNAPKNAPIGEPEDKVMKGLYVRGVTASGHGYEPFLERVAAHGMNAIVLDVKDFDGLLTYPSHVAVAEEIGAMKKPPIRSYARAVQFAHQKGIRVIARISCFHDQLLAKMHPSMAIRGVSGHVYHNGWVDPKSEGAQQYVVDLTREAMNNGADEVQLDYVRFPVIGMKNIDYGLDTKANPEAKVEVITNFVEHIHALTKPRGIPLSLDVFGVIAFGKDADMENLGQDPSVLAKHAEFLSPMVYPSHFDPGFMNMDAPADHPELVGMGVKHMNAEITEHDGDAPHLAKVRPWASAMRHTATNYGAAYIQEEVRTSNQGGGTGWLLWNPAQVYDVAWSALPRKSRD